MASINGNKVNNSGLWDPSVIIQAGINPKTGLPVKFDSGPTLIKQNIKKLLRIVDEQDALRRYTWYNLPDGLNGELLERILYYKGQGMFFYMPTNEQFYFLPYALDGNIDVYGRYTRVTPLPFMGSTSGEDKKEKPWIVGLNRKPIYDISIDEEPSVEDSCVLLGDYCKQLSQTTLPRQALNDGLLDVMSECIPYMRTALINSTGVSAMRVNSGDEYSGVKEASDNINKAALNGEKWIPVLGNIDFQDLTAGNVGKSEEFLMAMQSLDNFRLSLYGLDNGGLFEKKAHELASEEALNGHKASRSYNDGLIIRQDFCDIVNHIWGLGISCEPSETEMGDMNLDGMGIDSQDQSGIEGQQDNMISEEVAE